MKNYLVILLLLLEMTSHLRGQELNYAWHFTAGGVGLDQVLCSTIDRDGNSILAGNFEDSLWVGDQIFTTEAFATDGFILKLDPAGELLWIKELNVDEFDDVYPFALVTDSDNNILISGSFRGRMDADPSEKEFILVSELDDIYLSKLDAEGHLIWAQNLRANNSEERILDMHLTDDGELYLGGYIDISSNHRNDIPFLTKIIVADTAIEWNYVIATQGRIDGINEVAAFGDHIYLVGGFEGEGHFSVAPDDDVVLMQVKARIYS